jgi:hypothetical protein
LEGERLYFKQVKGHSGFAAKFAEKGAATVSKTYEFSDKSTFLRSQDGIVSYVVVPKAGHNTIQDSPGYWLF